MICYKDKTFCPFYKNCKSGNNCIDALTPAVESAARRWWGGDGAPISMEANKPQCFLNSCKPSTKLTKQRLNEAIKSLEEKQGC